jgi:glutaminyl-peptide cyclotransferase
VRRRMMTIDARAARWCVPLSLCLAIMSVATASQRAPAGQEAVRYGYRIVNTFPHDSRAFTQGLIFRGGFLYESTGLRGRSSLRKIRLETGEVIQQLAVDPLYFAEGLAEWNGELIQLTWQHEIAFRYDVATFAGRGTFKYVGEGWGLASDGKRLVMSDGSAVLRWLSPPTFRETGRLSVTDRGRPVGNLNELEIVGDEIFANVWQTDRIARISPVSGRVTGWIDLTGLLPAAERRDADAVLNGIAYDAAAGRLFVTGKLWPRIFEIQIVRR